MQTNALYYGDNLNILRDFVPDESVDLIYLDPPFNSNRDYNLIFKDQSGNKADAQILAFEDTWRWGPDASAQYEYLTNTARHHGKVPNAVSQIVSALRSGIGANEMMAYLVEMTVRLVELHRVLKADGLVWLHCDPTASHYLKLILDAIFGPTQFVNEVIWKRTHAHSGRRRLGAVHDVLLVYAKSPEWKWRPQRVSYSENYVESFFRFEDADGRRYRSTILTGSGTRTGSSGRPWRGVDPTKSGRHWAIPGYVRSVLPEPGVKTVQEALDQLDSIGRVLWPAKSGGVPSFKQYLDDMGGADLVDVWTDLPPISAHGKERLGYPTQKPEALLERIVALSSDEGDLVLDPFCGCGTALVAAQKLGRRWVGIDVTYLAIAVMKSRLRGAFAIEAPIIGAPTEVEGARALAEQSLQGRYQFQQWALTLVDAAPAGPATPKKGADSGIDGRLTFTDVGGQLRTVIVSVKSGGVDRAMVGDLAGVVHGEGAAMGLFITLEEPTKPMLLEAAKAGEFNSELSKRSYPKIQIITIRELLDGKKPEIPLLVLPAYQEAEKVEKESPGQERLFG